MHSDKPNAPRLNELTDEQKAVIEKLHKEGYSLLAGVIEPSWKKGKSYYIDSRLPISSKLRSQFNKINDQFID